jgi:hypothetical protein
MSVPPAIAGLNYEDLRRRMGKYKIYKNIYKNYIKIYLKYTKILGSGGKMVMIEGNSRAVTVA